MTTLLDRKRSATSNVQSPDEATLVRCFRASPRSRRWLGGSLPTLSKAGDCQRNLFPLSNRQGSTACFYPGATAAWNLMRPAPVGRYRPWPSSIGSVGWNAMIGNNANLIPFLASPALCTENFHDGNNHIIAGSGQSVGTAERVPGGWRVTGVWPFASGCQNAEWIAGTCVMMEDGSPIDAADGPAPMTRTCFMPAEHWEIRDT